MADGLQVVPPRLLDAFVCRNRGVPGGAGQIFAVLVGNVLALAIFKALS